MDAGLPPAPDMWEGRIRGVEEGKVGHTFRAALHCSDRLGWARVLLSPRFFYLYIFFNSNLHKYMSKPIIYKYIPLPPLEWAAGGLPPIHRAAGPKSNYLFSIMPLETLRRGTPGTCRPTTGRQAPAANCRGGRPPCRPTTGRQAPGGVYIPTPRV